MQADRDRDAARLGLEAAAVELRETSFGVDAARDDLVEARQALESVRKLEERRRDEHRAARAREEERELADVLEARAARAVTAARAEGGGMSVTEALARVSAIQSQIAALAPAPAPATTARAVVRLGARRPDPTDRQRRGHRRRRLARHAVAVRRR